MLSRTRSNSIGLLVPIINIISGPIGEPAGPLERGNTVGKNVPVIVGAFWLLVVVVAISIIISL